MCIKKAWKLFCCQSTHRGSCMPIKVEQTTSEPTPIWKYAYRKETHINISIASVKGQPMPTRSLRGDITTPGASTLAMFKTLTMEFARFLWVSNRALVNALNMSSLPFPPRSRLMPSGRLPAAASSPARAVGARCRSVQIDAPAESCCKCTTFY